MNEFIKQNGLNPKYTFDTFVVADNNRHAYMTVKYAAEFYDLDYNLLFLYGEEGTGKTHLLHSIAHKVLEIDKTKNVLYVTAEGFTNELVEALQSEDKNAIVEFREKYYNLDMLLVDDVQLINNDENVHEQFLDILIKLDLSHKKIVLSSDRAPREISITADGRFFNFNRGMTVIPAPNYETRISILQKKKEVNEYNVDDEVLRFIAANVKFNIREMEEVLYRLVTCWEEKEINISLAEEILRNFNKKRKVTPKLIIQMVAEYYEINGIPRSSTSVLIAIHLCRKMTDASPEEIDKCLGAEDISIAGEAKLMENWLKLRSRKDSSIGVAIDAITANIDMWQKSFL